MLKQRGIKTAIFQLPMHPKFVAFLDPIKLRAVDRALHELGDRNGVRYVNYLHDIRFDKQDYTVGMPDHLNSIGAQKFSRILKQEVLDPPLSLCGISDRPGRPARIVNATRQ